MLSARILYSVGPVGTCVSVTLLDYFYSNMKYTCLPKAAMALLGFDSCNSTMYLIIATSTLLTIIKGEKSM